MGHRAKWIGWVTLAAMLVPVMQGPGYAGPPRSTPHQATTLAQGASAQAQLAEADRLLFGEALQLWRTGQFQAASEALLQALELYRQPAVQAAFPQASRQGEGRTLTGLGTISQSFGQYEQALGYYTEALAIARDIGDREGEGSTLNNIGFVYDILGQYEQALGYFTEALAIAREIGDSPEERLRQRAGVGQILNNIGGVYVDLGQYEQALGYYTDALAIFQEVGDSPEERLRQRTGEGITLSNIGLVYNNQSQYEQALDYYMAALIILQDVGNRVSEGSTLNNIGLVYDSLGQYEQALGYFTDALAIAQGIGDRRGEGTTLNNIGLVYNNQSQYEKALGYYMNALTILRDIGDRASEGTTLNNIGAVYRNLGQYEQALGYYTDALAIRQAIGDRTGAGATLNNIGLVYNNLGQYEQALDYSMDALAIFQAIGNRTGESKTLNNIGLVYNNQSQYEQALDYYMNALTILQDIGDRAGEGLTLNNIGGVYDSLGQYEQALGYYTDALAIVQDIGARTSEGSTLNSIGVVYNDQGQYEQALSYHTNALAIAQDIGDRASEGTTLNNIGAVYRNLGQYEQALGYYTDALAIRQAIGDRAGEGATLNNLGGVYQNLEQYEQALGYYTDALAIAQAIGDRAVEGVILNNLGFTLEAMAEPELAIAFFKQSVNRWEDIRGDIRGLTTEQQQSFTETVAHTYRRLADLLLQADRVLEAQRVLDLLQVQELDDYLQDVQRTAQTQTGVPLRPEEQAALERFAANQDRIVALGSELRELEAIATTERTAEQTARIRELRQLQQDARLAFEQFFNSPEIQAIVAQLRTTTGAANLELGELNALQDNLKALSQNTVALYPLILDDRLELVVVTANAPPVSRTVNVGREELNRAIAEFRSALGSPNRDAVAPAQQLYDWLIRPIEADLAQADAEVVLYAPDGQLRYIPLAALHDGNQWLAQRLQVNNIVAASLTDLSNQPFAGGLTVLAAAFTEGQYDIPTSTRTLSFGGLTYAGREVENIARLVPQTDQRLNKAFDQALVLEMNDFKVVHLATHASFNPGPPQDSFILFGDGSHVTLDQVRRWNFPDVDLVVLSACETAVGDVPLGNGAEILGLGYLMEQAGAEAAIASLWAVSDGGTQVLMDAFYANLNQGMSKTEALQQAQMALIEGDFTASGVDRGASIDIVSTQTGLPLTVADSLTHPYYWAPFILIGNGL
ncbi:tetratricopeptide repeat protein [Nodosilinea sp. LEGE 07088]|uniref:CHAT domain-containing protein n=1 Tax=Nodosilinea sp. LEGE 07088 TaxID=2777968 RepID=UPI001882A2E9|nr:tetratricopeptide repeat protein [Nodosilinea sp. LEGE 07088]MBE9138016.1 tetratricopeptide repeat protein [Nodosilinea sp. LEGE 07088]